MENENLIHIKFEREEAIQLRRDILSSEINLLRMFKLIKNYNSLRTEELNLKLILLKKIKEVYAELRKLQIALPKLKIPRILKKEEEIKETDNIEEIKKSPYGEDLESQLQEIQDKLSSLQA